MPGRLYTPIFIPPLIVSTVSLPNATLGTAYSATVLASGGVPPYTWTLLYNVPNTGSWLSFSSAGVLSGTPGTGEIETLVVQVQDSNGTKASSFLQLQVIGTPLAIATTSPLPSATVNSPYSVTLTATGGLPPYTWSLVSATPNTGAWVAVSSGGVLSGTPGTAEAESITVRVTDSLATSVTKSFSLTVAAASTLSFPRVMLCGVGGDQSYGSNSGTGYPAWTTAGAGTAANTAIQTIGAYDIAVIAGTFEGWDTSGARDRENLTQALLKNGTYQVTKNVSRPTLSFYYCIMNATVSGNPNPQWQNLVSPNNWFLWESAGGTGVQTPAGGGQVFINYSAAWPNAIGSAGIGASICGRNYGTTSTGSPTGVQGPARTFGNYAAIKLLMRGYTGDTRFTFNAQMGSPSAAGIFLDEVFVALDGAGNVPDSSLDGISIAPGSQQGGGFPGLDTVQPVMARGIHNMFDQMQVMLTTYGTPGHTYYNFGNFGQYANKYQFGTATLTAGLESTLHGGLLENVFGAGASSWEVFQQGNFSAPGTPYPSGAPNALANYYQGMDFCLAPKLVGVGTKLPAVDGSTTASWVVGAGTTLTTVTAGTALEYQLMRYSLAMTLMDDGYWAPGVSGYDWAKVRWYDELGDDSLTQVNVRRGYLGTPLTTRPTTPFWAQGPLGVWWRAFSGGGVVWNPRGNGAQAITLPQQYQALTGTQQPTINNGALVTSLTIPDGDGRIFILPSGQAWQFSDLITGYTPRSASIGNGTYNWHTQNDGGTTNVVTWMSDASGSFLRVSGPNGAGVASGTFGVRFETNATGFHDVCVQYDIRRSSNSCSKQLKTYGWGQVNNQTNNTSNATFGCTMGGYSGTGYGVYYGDVATGANDVSVAMLCSGYPTNNLPTIGFGSAFSRTPYPVQSPTVATNQDITGTVWETYMVHFHASSNSAADGQISIWRKESGVWNLKLRLSSMWNCSSNTQDRGGFGLYEYSTSSGFHEDYRNVYLMFAAPVGMP